MDISSRSPDDIQDELDILAAQCGEPDALRGVVERWQTRLLQSAHRMTGDREGALDVVQETWVSAVKGIGRLRDPAGFKPWIYRILTRRAADWIRRKQRIRKTRDALGEIGDSDPSHDPAIECLRDAINLLPEKQRSILRLHYTEGFRICEIAETLGIPSGTVKSRLSHAREALRKTIYPNQVYQ